ncbi:MAG: hypothetical protein GTN70_10100 [Deltaproteobacteria bacterium]|nr:hypothetical protein [Deltaproteobacteria bacterium]NIS78168.1 hypothetical protein [Deltaproteobacteria bacterium]
MGLRSGKAGQPRGWIKSFYTPCFLILIAIVIFSCGYHLGQSGRKSNVLGEKEISIGKITNETAYNRVGITLAEKIKDSLAANGIGGSFDGGGNYLVKGTVHVLKERPVGFSEERLGLEYEIFCSVSLELIETATGESVFLMKDFANTSTYYRGVDPSYSRTNRERAVDFVLERISIRFVDFLKEI